MKITLPSFSIEERDEARDGLAVIEYLCTTQGQQF